MMQIQGLDVANFAQKLVHYCRQNQGEGLIPSALGFTRLWHAQHFTDEFDALMFEEEEEDE